jgi:hypothetical protein
VRAGSTLFVGVETERHAWLGLWIAHSSPPPPRSAYGKKSIKTSDDIPIEQIDWLPLHVKPLAVALAKQMTGCATC